MRQNLCSPACEIFDLQPSFCHLIRTIHPSICPHPFEYRLLAFSAASVSGPQWKEDSLCRCVPHPSAFDKWKYKGSHSSVCAQTVFRMYLTSSGQTKLLLYKINKLIIVFRLVCLHCLKAVIAANSWFTVRLYLLVVTGNRGFFKFLKGVHHQFSIAAKVEIPVDSLSLSNLLQQNKRCCFIHSVHFPALLSSLQPQPMLTQEIT